MNRPERQDFPAFLRLARLLESGLFADTPSDAFKALVPRTEADWESLFVSAQTNRALAPLSYIFATRPAFAALAGNEELAAMQEWHKALAFRSEEIRDQIVELAGLFAEHGQRMMLLKGAARLFDGLYPDISCRYSVDIDPLIEDPQMFYKTSTLGYLIYDDPGFDMKAVRSGDITAATGPAHHHLPALYRDGAQASVELHTRPFTTKYDDLAIPDLWDRARKVVGHPSILLPSLPHEVTINIVHTLFHGLAKEQFNLSVRDLFEGYLLYCRADEAQRNHVQVHFADRGHGRDFDLWRAVCFRVFNNPAFEPRAERFHQRFFDRLVEIQENPQARFRSRLVAKLKQFLFLEIWNRDRLRIRLRHLGSHAFWKRVAAHFGQSRKTRK